MKRTVALALSLTGVVCVAFAAWLAIDLIEGEGSTTVGKAPRITVPVKVAFVPAEGFTPEKTPTCVPAESCTGGESMNATIEAPVGTSPTSITGYTSSISTTQAGCEGADFVLTDTDPTSKEVQVSGSTITLKTPLAIVAGAKNYPAWGAGNVRIEVIESAPQTCEAAPVSVKLVAVHTP
jgi:hypothetical protein